MVMFEVWAPGHQRVELVLDGQRRLAMAARERGWWRLDVPAAPGDRYQFSLDGGSAQECCHISTEAPGGLMFPALLRF